MDDHECDYDYEHDVDTCPDCQPDLTLWQRAKARRPHPVRRWRTWRADWKAQWSVGVVVGYVAYAHRVLLDDAPQLQGMIDHEIKAGIEEQYPHRWRYDDARYAWTCLRAAVRGRPRPEYPWRYEYTMQVSAENAVLFERNMVALIGEKRRLPVEAA